MSGVSNWKRRAVLAGAVAGVALMAAGSGTASAATKLTVWCWNPFFNGDTMMLAMSEYQKTHPDVSLEAVDVGNGALAQKLQTQLASGSTEGLPDIVLMEDYWAQRMLVSFPDAFEPVGAHVDLSGMAPYKVAAGTVGDVQYSMPYDSGVAGFFYHTADLEAAGYKAADLQDITWDQLIEIGKKVEEKTGKKLITEDVSGVALLRIMLQSAGIWYVTPDMEVTAETDPKFKAVAETYVKVMGSGIVDQADGWDNFVRGFSAGGKATGVISGVWITAMVKENKDEAGKWSVAPIPKIGNVEGAVNAGNQGGSSWYVLKGAANKDLAIDFLKEVWGKDIAFYEKILVDKGALGSLLAAREAPAFKSADPFFGGQNVWADFSNWLTKVPEVNYGMFTAEAEAAATAYFPDVYRGKIGFDEALDNYTKRLKQQLQ